VNLSDTLDGYDMERILNNWMSGRVELYQMLDQRVKNLDPATSVLDDSDGEN
jgi:hypothetical protein